VLLVLFAFHLHADRAMGALEGVFVRIPFGLGRPLSEGLRAFGGGLAVLQAPPGHLLIVLGQSFVLWLLIDLSVFLNNLAFGLDFPFHASFLIIAFLVVGVAIPTPGMVGGYHAAYLLALTKVYGVDPGTAAAAGITGHALSNLPVLVGGLLLLPGEGLTIGKVAKMTDDDETGKRP
jgi:uncharacterized membrane protein YbhN (UPF0104 family)